MVASRPNTLLEGHRMARTRPGRILGDQGRLHRHDRHPSQNSSRDARWRLLQVMGRAKPGTLDS